MTQYSISFSNPHTHFIQIEAIFETQGEQILNIQLPAWRPGRYELGNFAKNVRNFKCFDDTHQELLAEKVTKDCWKVSLINNSQKIRVSYEYYANELNAGSTYLDELQLYVNPVNCLVYVPSNIQGSCELNIDVPDDFMIAIGLKKVGHRKYQAANFHELVDSPFIASPSIQHRTYEVEGKQFFVWMQGEAKPNWNKVVDDFKQFTIKQLQLFKHFPAEEYHFLIQVLPFSFYHGVEHLTSTVIAIGPSYDLNDKSVYDELMGVSSHELFHVWNIKSIRPAEMFPYDYTKENYSHLGYVAEGITTYYGDLMLLRSNYFSLDEYLELLAEQITKHEHNFGRFNYSVAESSFDTWLDGYVPGVPNRKISIYADGCVLAFIADVLIRKHSKNQFSMDEVIRGLYVDYALKNKGYTEKDYQLLLEKYAGIDFTDFFKNYIHGKTAYTSLFVECLQYLGLILIEKPSLQFYEAYLGVKIAPNGNEIVAVYPDSIAEKIGMSVGDEILSLNGKSIVKNLHKWCAFYADELMQFTLRRKQRNFRIELQLDGQVYYKNYTIKMADNLDAKQHESLLMWKGEA
jgi:predicted metalloprotease with PDZ domain